MECQLLENIGRRSVKSDMEVIKKSEISLNIDVKVIKGLTAPHKTMTPSLKKPLTLNIMTMKEEFG